MLLHQIDISINTSLEDYAHAMVVDAERRLLSHHKPENIGVAMQDGHLIVDEDAFAQLLFMRFKDVAHL